MRECDSDKGSPESQESGHFEDVSCGLSLEVLGGDGARVVPDPELAHAGDAEEPAGVEDLAFLHWNGAGPGGAPVALAGGGKVGVAAGVVPLLLEGALDELLLHEVPELLHLPHLLRLLVHVPDLVGELVHVPLHRAVGHCNDVIALTTSLPSEIGCVVLQTEDEDEEENKVDEDLPQSRPDHHLPLLSHRHVRRVPQTWLKDFYKMIFSQTWNLSQLTGHKSGEGDPTSCRAIFLGGRVSVQLLLQFFAQMWPYMAKKEYLLFESYLGIPNVMSAQK